jgi:predicted PurR-regulated permease PerM
MVVLVVGSEFAGLWGIILGPPLVAAAKEVYLYFRSYWEHPLPYQIPLQQPAQTIGQSDDSPTTP